GRAVGLLHQVAARDGLRAALRGEVDAHPAGEQVLGVPVALAVAEQYECVGHGHRVRGRAGGRIGCPRVAVLVIDARGARYPRPLLTTAPDALADVPVVLLDLDGTQVESGPGILAAREHAFDVCGEPLPARAVHRTIIGPPLVDSFQHTLGLTAERARQLSLAYTEHCRDRGLLGAPP